MKVYIAYKGNLLSNGKMKVIAVCTSRDTAIHICEKHAADNFLPMREDESAEFWITGLSKRYCVHSVPVDECFEKSR